ncbi:iron chelate uptake ABC transporter family permease subunit [Streptomyces sp. NPDC002740]
MPEADHGHLVLAVRARARLVDHVGDAVGHLHVVGVGAGGDGLLDDAPARVDHRRGGGGAVDHDDIARAVVGGHDRTDVRVAGLGLVPLVPLVLVYARRPPLLEVGDDTAAALGVPPERSRLVLLCAGTGLTAMAVAAAGPIPFVAMAAPQLARRVTRARGAQPPARRVDRRPAGLRRRPGHPALLPVGVVTGVAGGAYLAWLLRGERGAGRIRAGHTAGYG